MLSSVHEKNPLTVFLKVLFFLIAFQILLGISLVIGYLIEGKISWLYNDTAAGLFDFVNHKVLAWTGLFLLLVGFPVASIIGRFAMRNRSMSFYYLEESWMKFSIGFGAGVFFTVAITSVLLIVGNAKIVAFPSRLRPQELVASLLGYGVIMILVGFYEEIMFRGVLTCEWALRWKSWILGITAGGTIFGLIHTMNIDGSAAEKIPIVLSGLIFSWFLAVLMIRFKSLKAAIGVHAGWNFGLGGLLGCTLSGKRLNLTAFSTDIVGPGWITGGRFGLETSILINAILLTLLVILWYQIDWKNLLLPGQARVVSNQIAITDEE